MNTETILYISIAGIIALLLALFQYIYKAKNYKGIKVLLTFLRFVTLFSVFILIVNPQFYKTVYFDEKPNLIVAVDNSESVKYLGHDTKTNNLVEKLKNSKILNDHFSLDFFSFGKIIKPLDSLTFSEYQTNPSIVFDQLSQVYSNSLSPTLLITDGNQTYGNDYEYSADNYNQVVFPIILGDTITYTDLKIEQLNVNRYSYLKNEFPVEIFTVYNGKEKVQTKLIIKSGDQTVFSKELTFDENHTSRVVNLNLPANTPGIRSYKAELQPIINEKNKINNVKNFAVEIIDRKTHVALISDMLHPDLGALKNAIESNDQRQVSILKPLEFLKNSSDFQQAILYQPNKKFKEVYENTKKSNINTFTILGTKTAWVELNELQPDLQQKVTNQYEGFQAELNDHFNVFIVDDLEFSKFPPLETEFGTLTFSGSPEIILYKSINGHRVNEPLLATFENGQKKSVVLNGEGIWRWRAQSFLEKKSFAEFDDFIGKIVQYLDTNQKRSRLNVFYESFYNGNDHIILTAQYFNQTYEFDPKANLEIALEHKENGQKKNFPLILKQNNFEVDLSGLDAGDYNFTVKALGENISDSGEFKILEYNIERQFLNANVPKLKRLAVKSEGKSFFINDTKHLIDSLIADPRFVTIQKSTRDKVSIIDFYWLLIIVVLSLAAEWFIRKYHGLI